MFEDNATVWCLSGGHIRHGRFYDPEHAVARVLRERTGLSATVFRITNAAAVAPGCCHRFALVLGRPA